MRLGPHTQRPDGRARSTCPAADYLEYWIGPWIQDRAEYQILHVGLAVPEDIVRVEGRRWEFARYVESESADRGKESEERQKTVDSVV